MNISKNAKFHTYLSIASIIEQSVIKEVIELLQNKIKVYLTIRSLLLKAASVDHVPKDSKMKRIIDYRDSDFIFNICKHVQLLNQSAMYGHSVLEAAESIQLHLLGKLFHYMLDCLC